MGRERPPISAGLWAKPLSQRPSRSLGAEGNLWSVAGFRMRRRRHRSRDVAGPLLHRNPPSRFAQTRGGGALAPRSARTPVFPSSARHSRSGLSHRLHQGRLAQDHLPGSRALSFLPRDPFKSRFNQVPPLHKPCGGPISQSPPSKLQDHPQVPVRGISSRLPTLPPGSSWLTGPCSGPSRPQAPFLPSLLYFSVPAPAHQTHY